MRKGQKVYLLPFAVVFQIGNSVGGSPARCLYEGGQGSQVQKWTVGPLRAYFVEKLRISDVVFFRKEPVIRKSQMRSAMRRSELPHERQKTNLTEPLGSKSWLRRTDKNFTDFAKNGVFQQYRLAAII